MNLLKFIKTPKPYIINAIRGIQNRLKTVFYKGDLVLCEICGWQGRHFFDENCPKCSSLPRTRLIPYSLRHFYLNKHAPKILHIAPNVNEFHYVKNHITSLSNYDRLNIKNFSHINLIQDLTRTTLNSNTYDLIMAWHVLEHIKEDKKAIAEVYRLLKTHGHFLVSVPIYPTGNKETFEDSSIPYEDFERTHGHYDHCRSCGMDYFKRFESVGFKTETLLVNSLSSKSLAYYGLRADHVVWCFTK